MQKRTILYSAFLLIFLTATENAPASSSPSRIESLRQSVFALDSAWTRAINDLLYKKHSDSLQESEKEDYAKFITYLGSRMDHYCHLLKSEGGEPATVDTPCTDSQQVGSGLEPPAASTKVEQIADLDKSLAESLGEFDEQLLKEERRIAARIPATRESGGGYGGRGDPGSSGQPGSGQPGNQGQTGDAGKTSQGGSVNSQSGQNSSFASSSGKGAGVGMGSKEKNNNSATGTQEIASGYDDIVARQLREAAEKESDPELKEKLWEEYRKYKEGIN